MRKKLSVGMYLNLIAHAVAGRGRDEDSHEHSAECVDRAMRS